MRQIEFQGQESHIDAGLHALIYEPESNKVLFASVIGPAARAMVSNISTNSNGSIYVEEDEEDRSRRKYLSSYGGSNYKWHSKKQDDMTHAVIMHKDARLDHDSPTPIIVAFDGDLVKALGDRLAKIYTLPSIRPWYEYLFRELDDQGHLEHLEVLTTNYVSLWQDMRAVRLKGHEITNEKGRKEKVLLPKELIVGILSKGLRDHNIHLPPGTAEAPVIDRDLETLAGYLETYAPDLVDQINRKHPPIHDLNYPISPYIAEVGRLPVPAQAITAHAIAKSFLMRENGYFSFTGTELSFAPDHSAIDGLDEDQNPGKSAILCNAVMGTGKSEISLVVAHILQRTMEERKGRKRFLTFLQAPGSTLKKWREKEISPVLPDAQIHVWNHATDVLRDLREGTLDTDGHHVVIMSRDKIKAGATFRFGGVWKRVLVKSTKLYNYSPTLERDAGIPHHILEKSCEGYVARQSLDSYAWHCPECDTPLTQGGKKKDEEEEFVPWDKFAYGDPPDITPGEPLRPDGTPLSQEIRWKPADHKLKCSHCGTKMIRPMVQAPKKHTYLCDHPDMALFRTKRERMDETKVKPIWGTDLVIRHFRKRLGIDLYVVDEVHQLSGGSSAQGISFGTVSAASRWTLGLTGTLTSGKASDIFHILWRTATTAMKKEGFDHNTQASFSKRFGVFQETVRQEEDFGSASRKRTEKVTTKEMPGLSPHLYHLIMDMLVSLELEDLGLPLVALHERIHFSELSAEHLNDYKNTDKTMQSDARKATRLGVRGAWSKYIPCTITKSDMPWVPMEELANEEARRIDPLHVTHDDLTGKERDLLELVAKERAEGRRVMVYVTYVGRFRQGERLAHILTQAGFKVGELKASDPEKRMEVLDQMVEDGVDVVVSNYRLVSVGLDLLAYPTLIFYQLSDQVKEIRQAAKRAWRLGQTRECRVIYMITKDTYQMEMFQRTMAKRAHAMLLEGRIDKTELADYGSADIHASLTKTIVNAIGDADDLAKKWEKLAARDVPKGIEMLSEQELAEALKHAFEELTDQTRVMCGRTPIHKAKKVFQQVRKQAEELLQQQDVYETVQASLFDVSNHAAAVVRPRSSTKKKKVSGDSIQLELF